MNIIFLRQNIVARILGVVLAGFSLQAASAQTARVWTSTTTGTYDWSDGVNWVGSIPDSTGESANFGASGATLQGNVTVNQDIVGLTIAGLATASVVQSGTLTVTGNGITLDTGNASKAFVTAGGSAPIPTYAINLNVTDAQGLDIVAQNHMIISGNITTVTTGTTLLTGGGNVFLGGTNSFNNAMVTNATPSYFATNTSAFGGSGTMMFNNTINQTSGVATRATGTTNFTLAVNSGTFTGVTTGRNVFSSGGTGTILNVTTSTFLNDTVGNAPFEITMLRSPNLPFSPTPTGIGTVMFSGSNFTITRNVQVEGDQFITGKADSRLEFAPATGTQTWSGNINRGAAVNDSWFALNSEGPVVVKSGNGKVILSGSNNYVFQTGVTVGTLLVNGVHTATATGGALNSGRNGFGDATTGNYLISSGGTLGGTGRIAITATAANTNMLLVQSGGFLAPGASIGQLTLDGVNISGAGSKVLNMATGARFVFELDGSGGTPDQLSFWNYVPNDVLLSNNAINLSLLGTETGGTYTVDLFTFFGNNGITAAASGIGSGLIVGTTSPNISSASIIYNTNAISLQYTVIPEPGSVMLLCLSAAGALVFFGRRRAVPAKVLPV